MSAVPCNQMTQQCVQCPTKSWVAVKLLGTNPAPEQVPNLLEAFETSIVDMDYVAGRLHWLLSVVADALQRNIESGCKPSSLYEDAAEHSEDENEYNSVPDSARLIVTRQLPMKMRSSPGYTFKPNPKLVAGDDEHEARVFRLKRSLAAYKQVINVLLAYSPYTPRTEFDPEHECSERGLLFNNCPDDGENASNQEQSLLSALTGPLNMLTTGGEEEIVQSLTPGLLALDHSFLESEYLEQMYSTVAKPHKLLDRDIIWRLFWRMYLHVTVSAIAFMYGRLQVLLTMKIQLNISRDIFRTRYTLRSPKVTTTLNTSGTISSLQKLDSILKCLSLTTDHYQQHNNLPRSVSTLKRSCDDSEQDEAGPACKRHYCPNGGAAKGDVSLTNPTHPFQDGTEYTAQPLRLLNSTELKECVAREDILALVPVLAVIVGTIERAQEYSDNFTSAPLEKVLKPFRARNRPLALHKFLIRLGTGTDIRLREAIEQFDDLVVGPDPPPGENEMVQEGRKDVAWYTSTAFFVGKDHLPLPVITSDSSTGYRVTDKPLNKPPLSVETTADGETPKTEFGNILTQLLLLFMFRLTLTQLSQRKNKYSSAGSCRVPRDETINYRLLAKLVPEILAIDQRVVKSVRDLLAISVTNRASVGTIGIPSFEVCRHFVTLHIGDFKWLTDNVIANTNFYKTVENQTIQKFKLNQEKIKCNRKVIATTYHGLPSPYK